MQTAMSIFFMLEAAISGPALDFLTLKVAILGPTAACLGIFVAVTADEEGPGGAGRRSWC